MESIEHLLGNIHNCDCLEFMKQLPDKCVDLVLTDPPYGIDYQSNKRVKSEKFIKIANDKSMKHRHYFTEFHRLLKDDTVAVAFCSWKNYHEEYTQLAELFDIKNVIIWHKPGGGIGDLAHSLSTDYEMAIVAHKGQCLIRGKRDGSVWGHSKVNPNDMVHPTEKPDALLARIINKFSDSGQIVFDAFGGSGSTFLAADKNGRKWFGCELDPKYVEIANKRIEAERNQLKLF